MPCVLTGADVTAVPLQLLSSNTRRTKVVELSSGTHRCALLGAACAAAGESFISKSSAG